MCAIFGIIGEYESKDAKRAFDTLKHRGEDSTKIIEENGLFLGVHRLSITSTSIQNTQPLKYKDNFFLFNGEIYNFEDLNQEFSLNASFESELIAKLFERFGKSFVELLEGMFAISIVTPREILLFRDRFGKKPLFYYYKDEFIFASEIRAIKALKNSYFERRELSTLLFFQSTIPPKTLFRDIYQLSPGESLIFDRVSKELKRENWYKPKSFQNKLQISSKDATKEIKRLFQKAIKKRIPKEVGFGALLSGGLDSSFVCATLAKYQKIDTFSIGYEGFESYDERVYAKVVAEHIGSNHTQITLSKEEFLDSLEEWVEHLDEPLLDPASVPLWHLIKTIKKETNKKVLFSGDGSDELFLGYRLYREYLDIERASELKHKNWLRNYFRANFSMNKEWERYKRVFSDELLYRSMAELFTDLQLNLLLKLNVKDGSSIKAISEVRERFLALGGEEHLDWYSFVDIHTILAELFLKKLDRVTMAWGIEARSPFLDKELVEFLLSLPSDIRVSDSIKGLLKRVAKEYLPDEIIYRKKKGFSYPFIEWLKELDELRVIDEVQSELGIFKESQLQQLLNRSKKSKRFKHHIFAIYLLSKWLKRQYL